MTIDDFRDELDGETGPVQAGLSKDEKNWAMAAHLSSLTSFIGIPWFLGPLIIYFVKKDDSTFVGDHAKEALNFGISVFIYSFVCLALVFVFFIGVALLGVLVVAAVVLNVMAGIKASEGKTYKYPFTIRLIS
jgi:uncharacterized Tic20 family protein